MKFMNKLRADDLAKHSAIVFAAMMVVNVCNMVFQMVMGRVLPEAEFTLLAAFLGVLVIMQRPLATLRTGLSYYSSLLCQDGNAGDIKRLVRKWLLVSGGPALLLCLASLLLCDSLANFFHLQRREPVLIAGAILPALFWTPVLSGAAQGFQKFGLGAVSIIVGAGFRLLLGGGFVLFLYPACGWAMLGHGLGMYACMAVLCVGLWFSLRGTSVSGKPLPSIHNYLVQSFFVLAAHAVLMNADVIFVKHYAPSDTQFAFAATLGRMVVFLPGAIVMAMFPKVASRGNLSNAQRRVFLRSLSYTALFVFATVVGCVALPGLLLRILFGITDASLYLKQMVGVMAGIMGLSALLNVVIQFLLAQHRFAGLSGVVLMAIIYYIGSHYCTSAWHVVAWSGATNLGALIWAGSIALRYVGKSGEGNT